VPALPEGELVFFWRSKHQIEIIMIMKTNLLALAVFVLASSVSSESALPMVDDSGYEGHYYDEDRKRQGYNRELFLVHLQDNFYSFIVYSSGPGQCKGVVSGGIKFYEGKGVYSDDNCAMLEIQVMKSSGNMRVTTRGCSSQQGYFCSLEGDFRKVFAVEFDW
jgi:hypothetical protein